MKNNLTREFFTAAAFLIVSVVLVNPFGYWMPDSAHMFVLALLVVTFGVFAVFILRERAVDERDELHRERAGRSAYLAGGAILLIGIVAQTLSHALDPWLVYALVGMVVAKVGARFLGERYN